MKNNWWIWGEQYAGKHHETIQYMCSSSEFLTTFLIHMPLNLTYLLGSTGNALYSHTVIKYDFCISI